MYREHRPHPALAAHIECYWTRQVPSGPSPGSPPTTLILPDGCMDILLSFGDRPVRADGKLTAGLTEPYVVGTMTRAVRVSRQGRFDLLGVRFRPGGAAAWLSAPARELVDGTAPLAALWGAAAAETHKRVGDAGNPDDRIRILETALLSRLERDGSRTDRRVLHASALITRHGGNVPIEHVAREAGLGRRQLERRFLDVVGLSPKTVARVARFRSAVGLLRSASRDSLAGIAALCGYTDQAHLTRDFRAFAGVTPGTYRKGLHPGPTE